MLTRVFLRLSITGCIRSFWETKRMQIRLTLSGGVSIVFLPGTHGTWWPFGSSVLFPRMGSYLILICRRWDTINAAGAAEDIHRAGIVDPTWCMEKQNIAFQYPHVVEFWEELSL